MHKHAREAADHLVCLYTFNSLVSILGSGSLPLGSCSGSNDIAQRIIKACKDQQKKLLQAHDKALAKLEHTK